MNIHSWTSLLSLQHNFNSFLSVHLPHFLTNCRNNLLYICLLFLYLQQLMAKLRDNKNIIDIEAIKSERSKFNKVILLIFKSGYLWFPFFFIENASSHRVFDNIRLFYFHSERNITVQISEEVNLSTPFCLPFHPLISIEIDNTLILETMHLLFPMLLLSLLITLAVPL